MTRGYLVMEKGADIETAVELAGSAYLWEDGYGREILSAYQQGNIEDYIGSLHKMMSREQLRELRMVRPEWYRRTTHTHSDDLFAEYGYVLKGGILLVYHRGKLLFKAAPDTIDRWLYIVNHLERFVLAYLYSEEDMDIQYQRLYFMFRQLTEHVQNGCTIAELGKITKAYPVEYEPVLLADDHCVDVWHNPPSRKSYCKRMSKGNVQIDFIVAKDYGKWRAYLQLPVIRISISDPYSSEKQATQAVRRYIRGHLKELLRMREVEDYWKSVKEDVMKTGMLDREKIWKNLQDMYEKQPWCCTAGDFSPRDIMRRINRFAEKQVGKEV